MDYKNKYLCLFAAMLVGSQVCAQKKLFIPEDLRGMDLEADTSQWSLKRSIETNDLIFMWERGFGADVSNPPQLEGHDMSFNLLNLRDRVQSFYHFFRDTLGFVTPQHPSKADRYKMMVMVNYSLDGTAYGGTYDNFIGALWVAPNRIQDMKMNCMAHELGHSFQSQIMADSIGDCWGGTGFFEMASQWMLWQVNPDWLTDENYHFEAFKKLTHKAYLHMDNIYHSPYVLQWWSDQHGRKFIAELFRQGKIGEDPVDTYKRMNNLTQAASGWLRPKELPEGYGFNAIKLDSRVNLSSKEFRLRIKGDHLRYGFVGVTTDDESYYSLVNASTFAVPKGKTLKHLYLIVMGAPERHEDVMMSAGSEQESPAYRQFPYEFQIQDE